jgi:glutathione S-transferase
MLLTLKQLPHEYVPMHDFRTAPDWFRTLNPLGKVPVLLHGDAPVFESAAILEYIEDVFPEPPARAADPLARAYSRILAQYCDKTFVAAMFRLLMNQDAELADERMDAARTTWLWLDRFLAEHAEDGEWPFGSFGLAEIFYAPFFRRYAAVRYYRYFDINADEAPRVTRWASRCNEHPVVQSVCLPEADVIKLYLSHSRGWGAGRLPPAGSENSMDPSVPYEARPMPPRPPRDYWTAASSP